VYPATSPGQRHGTSDGASDSVCEHGRGGSPSCPVRAPREPHQESNAFAVRKVISKRLTTGGPDQSRIRNPKASSHGGHGGLGGCLVSDQGFCFWLLDRLGSSGGSETPSAGSIHLVVQMKVEAINCGRFSAPPCPPCPPCETLSPASLSDRAILDRPSRKNLSCHLLLSG